MFARLRSWRWVAAVSTVATFFILVVTLYSSDSDSLSWRPTRVGPSSPDGVISPSDGEKGGNQAGSSPSPSPLDDGASHDVDLDVGGVAEEGKGEGLKSETSEDEKAEQQQQSGLPKPTDHELELVVASIKSEDTSWFHTYLPDWHKNIYVADDPGASLTVPKNKGREAMVYLTYLIDRYDDLPGAVLFVHASRFAWHNDDPDYDALPTLLDFRLPYLRQQGYVNLRCVWVIGCPREIRPVPDATARKDGEKLMAKHVYKQSFEELLPDVPVPDLVAVSCCSQFGVTRDVIRRRPKADYVRFRDWLLATPLDDAINGRIFEFAWHIIFGKEAAHCPSAADCYCNVFGHCNMTCTESGCENRYTLPPFSTLPKGWPKVGWEQEERNFTGPL